ncbi:MAG: HAMP domain-containing sensor histidine kinase [Christensenellaceae bacterium]
MDTKSKKFRYSIGFKIIAWLVCLSTCFLGFLSILGMTSVSNNSAITDESFAKSEQFLNDMTDINNGVYTAYFGYGKAAMQNAYTNYISNLKNAHLSEIKDVLMNAGIEGDYNEYFKKYTHVFENLSLGIYAQANDAQPAAVEYSSQTVPDSVTSDSEQKEVTAAPTTDRIQEETSAEVYSAAISAEAIGNTSAAASTGETAQTLNEYDQMQIDAINQKYLELLTNAQSYISGKYTDWAEKAIESIEKRTDMFYVIIKDGKVLGTNVKSGDPLEFVRNLDSNRQHFAAETNKESIGVFPTTAAIGRDNGVNVEEYTIYSGMSNDVFAADCAEYIVNYNSYMEYMYKLIACIAVFSIAFAWLMYTAGKNTRNDEVKVTFADAIFLDIGAVCLILIDLLLAIFVYDLSVKILAWDFNNSWVISMFVFLSIGTTLLLMWCMSLSRRIKRNENYTLFGFIFRGTKGLYKRSGVKAKAVWLIVLYFALAVISVIFVIYLLWFSTELSVIVGLIVLTLYIIFTAKYVLKKAAAVKEIKKGIEHISQGELDYKIKKDGGMELDEIAGGIENIAQGFELAVQKEVKAEHMKAELITNVSHDLKTPLTSILTYIDLLKSEGLSNPHAQKYLDILDGKAQRLKSLTEDLFEAAKASSGDMTVNMMKIEIVQFMEQALGEMSDKLEASTLSFVNELPDEKMYVYADGKLLWRIISNVLDNVLKYALDGSRVYMNILKNGEDICIIVKNVSRDALNMTEEELMERFKRGDESRHTEGSGLGLSIARSFMQLMGGVFRIEIDGDLFKVVICFKEMDAESVTK